MKALIVPILIEQILTTLVGMIDTLMISYAGQAAVSGVSLINQLSHAFIFIFGSLAAGGSVVTAQYLGRGDKASSTRAASQFVALVVGFGILITVLSIGFRNQILSFLFGSVEKDVMDAALIYLVFTAASWPFLGLCSSSNALYRAMNRTRIIMDVSIIMNIINVVGNFIGIFILHAGVLGVAVPTLIARATASFILIPSLTRKENPVTLSLKEMLTFHWPTQKRILSIALPGAIESGLFNFSKIAITSMISLFGTVQIAAYGVAGNFWSMGSLCAQTLGFSYVTVIGQSLGAGDIEGAEYYFRKILRITYLLTFLWNLALLLAVPLILTFYALPQETKLLALEIIFLHNVIYAAVGPVHSSMPHGLKAAGDAKFVMYAAIFATVVCRVFFSYLFGVWLGLGVIGVVLGMAADWSIKAVLVWTRYKSGRWKKLRVI